MGMNLERNSDHLPIYEGVLTLTNYQLHFAPTIFSTYVRVWVDPRDHPLPVVFPSISVGKGGGWRGERWLVQENDNRGQSWNESNRIG